MIQNLPVAYRTDPWITDLLGAIEAEYTSLEDFLKDAYAQLFLDAMTWRVAAEETEAGLPVRPAVPLSFRCSALSAKWQSGAKCDLELIRNICAAWAGTNPQVTYDGRRVIVVECTAEGDFPSIVRTLRHTIPAHLLWNIHAHIPVMIILESSGGMKEKDLRFQTFCNYWNCYSFDGRRQFDGSLLFNQRRGGLSLARTHIKTSAVMPHRVYPSKISAGVLAFRTDEKVFAILDGGRTVFDNMGEFIRLNGQNDLNGSWLLWQRARSPIYKDFQITETVCEKKKLFAVATVITVVQHTPIFFQKAKLKTSVLLFAPTKERLNHRIVFLSKAKETVLSDIREFFFSGFSMRNRESISILEKYSHRFQEKKDFLSRQLSIFIPLAKPSGSGNAELFAGIFEVLNVMETLGFYQNWRVINRNLSPVLSPVSVETNEKISNDTAIKNIKNVTFSPYNLCNNSTFNVKVAITTVRPSRADGTYRLDGTLRFDGKALPLTETL